MADLSKRPVVRPVFDPVVPVEVRDAVGDLAAAHAVLLADSDVGAGFLRWRRASVT
ncbi:hypothetical protein ACH4E7_43130 [Kitasatospora sp. NPDC018058]|uniref:hypothetical protein n=1 Tax=Kitasatospora sp. NPDC018058 TaxID=3364025 RepID=UPI0037BED3BD